jgi:quinone-modifying oxidoreductase, subunit QmoB
VAALRRPDFEPMSSDSPGPAQVDPGKCTMCLTCVRLCPHGAISFRKNAEVDPVTCARCGICAVECPMEAISLAPSRSEKDLGTRIREGLACIEGPKKIVAFVCSRSGAHAMESAWPTIREGVAPVIVPCAGTIDISHVFQAFQEGADGVIAAGCYRGNCASVYGTVLAAERLTKAQVYLEEVGIASHRVAFTSCASNTPGALVRAVREMERAIDPSAQ